MYAGGASRSHVLVSGTAAVDNRRDRDDVAIRKFQSLVSVALRLVTLDRWKAYRCGSGTHRGYGGGIARVPNLRIGQICPFVTGIRSAFRIAAFHIHPGFCSLPGFRTCLDDLVHIVAVTRLGIGAPGSRRGGNWQALVRKLAGEFSIRNQAFRAGKYPFVIRRGIAYEIFRVSGDLYGSFEARVP